MDSKEIEINETHICVLKMKNQELFVDFYPLRFEFNEELSELERIAFNPNRTSFELEEFVRSSPLKVLLDGYNYCENLSSPYQGLESIKTPDYLSFRKELDDQKQIFLIENNSLTPEQIQEKLDAHENMKKNEFLEIIKGRVIPYMLDKSYRSLENNKEILAFSHRRVGFSLPKFKLSRDFDVIFKSNFGYGTASYFYTNIRYKGIDILPYSDWIRYRYAQQSEIIRYTRRHKLINESWRLTMDFTAELHNYSLNKPQEFINKWIVNECIEMVCGLEDLLNRDKKFEVINSYFIDNVRTTLIGNELVNFKGERISGALTFLEKIKALNVFSTEIPSLIERILICNLSIYSDLHIEINKLKKNIDEYSAKKDELFPKWNSLMSELETYNLKKKQYIDDFKVANPTIQVNQELLTKLDKYFGEKFPKYPNLLSEFIPISLKYNLILDEIKTAETWHKKYCGYLEVIERHFKLINRPLFKIQQG